MLAARTVIFVWAILAIPALCAAQSGNGNWVNWPRPLEVPQGQVAQVKVSGENLAKVEGRMGKETLYFYPTDDGGFSALLGVDVEANPATVKLWLKATSLSGGQQQTEVALKIKAKNYHKESFNVAPGFDQMTPENLAEIRREQAAFDGAFATSSNERYWEIPFVRPVPQEASASSFGSRRNMSEGLEEPRNRSRESPGRAHRSPDPRKRRRQVGDSRRVERLGAASTDLCRA
jgi:hypothetical protein